MLKNKCLMLFNRVRAMSTTTKITMIVLLIVLLNTVIIGTSGFLFQRNESIRNYSNRSVAIAKTAAMAIDANEFWYALNTNEKNEHYMRLQGQFERIKEEENLLYFYGGTFDPEFGMIMYIEGHGNIFGLNGHVPLSIFPQAAFDTFEYGTAHVTDIYRLNIDGTWGISAYAPIFNEDNETIGLIGVLISLSVPLERSSNYAWTMFGISFLAFFVLIWIPMYYVRRLEAKQKSVHNQNEIQLTKLNLVVQSERIGLWDLMIQKTDPFNPANINVYSDQFRNLIGYSDETDFPNVLSSWADKLHPDDAEVTLNALKAHLYDATGNTPFDVEYRLLKKNGEYAYYSEACETVRDRDGAPLRACGSLIDITDRKKMVNNLHETSYQLENALNEANKATEVKNNSLRALENILNSIDAAIYTTVPETGEILFINTWLKNAFNVKGDDATGQYCYKVLRNRDSMCGFCPCYELKKEPDKVIVWEEHIPELGGVHVRHFDCLIDWPDGRKVHLQHAIDITALVNATEEAQAANRAKSVFLANINHEIRTPLNAITGMTNIGKSSADTKQKNNCFERIEEASGLLLGIINSILDMSKIESGTFNLSLSEFNFEKTLHKVVNIISLQIHKKQIKFNVSVDTSIPEIIIGDEQRLAQVITNLLGNAVKFTPEEGSIRIDTCLLGEEDGVCTVKVTVTDSGIGIDKEQQSNLFRPFWQSENNVSRQFEGTGLGLSISKNIVEMMGGEIWVESEIGKGASFIFTIKVKRGEAKEHRLLKRGVIWSNVRVLAVDDEQDTLDFFTKITDELGIKCCDTVLSGEEALKLIEQGRIYDICFIDWRLPGIDGIELAKILKTKTENLKNAAVVLFSADAVNAASNNDNHTYIDKYLSKPLFPFTIIDAINDCLGMAEDTRNNNIKQKSVPQFANRRILLAEDVEINREIFITLLEPSLLEIDCAVNGKEAVAMFSESPEKYDMIFMDLQMPQMNGYEATESIRALETPKAKTIPIIAMTANTFAEDVDKCLKVGMNGHVGKPLDYDKVLELIADYL